ncbi:outer membrane beta-barrel protein [Mesorhizobium sp. WSM4904]|uniref:outer membrane protein n=1 Tax=Mesorhizobium sp. WSM4904 TaxID=3038545 RepID=UPI00241868A8|nr:outer membrane beta-barrel protein [Mesorhizobium sp. WSM4904]WFP61357.1 outer membrane beta-barrel protein [Mesorhizobium sp. WSM4904]
MLTRFSAKSIFLSAVSAVALMSAAQAADVVQEQAAPGFNWSGLYVGFGVGTGATVHQLSVPGLSFNGIGGNGVFGELTAGYDHMVSERVLLGGFIDATYGNIGPSLSASGLASADLQNVYGFDVGVRAGYLLNPNTLGYVLGGYSWQHFKLDGDLGGGGFDFTQNRGGYVLGVGMETVLSGNWTLKTEYRYADYGDKSVLDLGGGAALNIEPSTHTFHIGANYRFGAQNGGGASFAAPSYNWTGFYAGGALGAGTQVHDLSLAGAAELDGIGGEGVFGEASVGYDQDFGAWVAGLQFDARYSGIRSKLDIAGVSIKGDADYGFDALARVGAKVNESTLAYVIGGYSWQHFKLHASAGGASADIYDWGSSGFSVGGGLETAVSNNMTVGLEYRYSQYEKEDFGSGGFLEDTPRIQTVRLGAKYKFN